MSRKTFEFGETVVVAVVDMVYVDALRATVESMTGLALTLGTCGAVAS